MNKDLKILVIDSEKGFMKTAREALAGSYDVVFAFDAKEGLEKAKHEQVAAIVLGYLEPRGTSYKLHNELRNNTDTENIPLLIIDVRPEEHSRKGWKRHEGLHMNAQDYMAKPVEPAELLKTVEWIIRRASAQPMGLKEASQQMEEALQRIDKIEALLTNR